MCGNGMRCFAKYLYESRIISKKRIRVDTRAGTIIPEVITNNKGLVESIRVDLGEPALLCKDIPFKSENEKAIEEPLKVGEKEYSITAVGMGNPNAVIFVDDITKVDVKTTGPLIENHERFPEKTNVEFVEVVSPDEVKMKVWERGAGMTLACGTGACACLVAASITGRTSRKATVHLDGGDLEIFWDENTNHVFKTGPAVEVFKGVINLGSAEK
jgi:diaminopimelate epimerase